MKIIKIPKTCRECGHFFQTDYICHNERGKEAHCTKGYMAGRDMRDFPGTRRFEGCRLEEEMNSRIPNSDDTSQ